MNSTAAPSRLPPTGLAGDVQFGCTSGPCGRDCSDCSQRCNGAHDWTLRRACQGQASHSTGAVIPGEAAAVCCWACSFVHAALTARQPPANRLHIRQTAQRPQRVWIETLESLTPNVDTGAVKVPVRSTARVRTICSARASTRSMVRGRLTKPIAPMLPKVMHARGGAPLQWLELEVVAALPLWPSVSCLLHTPPGSMPSHRPYPVTYTLRGQNAAASTEHVAHATSDTRAPVRSQRLSPQGHTDRFHILRYLGQ